MRARVKRVCRLLAHTYDMDRQGYGLQIVQQLYGCFGLERSASLIGCLLQR